MRGSQSSTNLMNPWQILRILGTLCLFLGLIFIFSPTWNSFLSHPSSDAPPSHNALPVLDSVKKLRVGADNIPAILSIIEDSNQNVGLVVNHTSQVGNSHLVDTLLSLGVAVKKVFAPEHGFRGQADAGEQVSNSTDIKTGLPIISLYGKQKKPSAEHLKDIDMLIFDIQDVGTRFYTYISTMHLAMEACAENNKRLLVLDRPNPNGSYIDGPIREPAFKSFVGMHPIPIVHALTVAELALMINGEKWLEGQKSCDLIIVKNENYQHNLAYSLPLKPSPNLPNDQSILLYPSLCLFEGTWISVGRGTDFPFQVLGAPQSSLGDFTFKPRSIDGMSKNPKYKDQTCYGIDLRRQKVEPILNLQYLLDFYNKTQRKDQFFNNYFDTLAGTAKLRQQIQAGRNEKEIRESWEEGLAKYRHIRKKYLLYP